MFTKDSCGERMRLFSLDSVSPALTYYLTINLLFNYLTISPAQLIQLEVAKILKTQIGEKEVYYFSVLHMAYVHALGIQLLNSLTLCDTP